MRTSRRPWSPLLAAILLATCLAAGGGPALAAPVALPQILNLGGQAWLVTDTGGTSNGLPTGGVCNNSPGLTVLDASVGGAAGAFHRGLQVWINDAIFVPPATVDRTTSGTNIALTAGPVTMSGLSVTVQYRLSFAGGTGLRTVARLQNPSSGPITVTVKWVSNIGGDDNVNAVRYTSSGNSTFTNLDSWVVISDDPVTPVDVVKTFVVFGPSVGPRSPRVTPLPNSTFTFTCNGTEGVASTFAVTVPPGRARSLMFVNQIHNTNEAALLAAAVFTDTVIGVDAMVADLNPVLRSEILNWDFTLKEQGPDFDGDGRADIVTGTGPGGAAHIRVFSGNGGSELLSFFAFDPGFTGGVRVATCDLTGDGVPDIVTAAGPGGGAHVRSFDGVTTGQLPGTIGSFFPYDPGYLGGTYVACADANGDGTPDIITGTGVGGGPHVRIWSGVDGSEIFGFLAYDAGFTGGVFVAD
jgi:hypothetical protein